MPPSPERPRLSRVARLTLWCAAATALVGLASTLVALTGTAAPPRGPATLGAAATVAVATIVNLSVRFVRWQFVLRRLGVRLPTMPSLAAYVGSFAFLPVPLYLGQLYARARLVPATPDERGTIVLAFLVEAASSAWALAVLATPLLPAPVGVAVVAAGGLLLLPGVVRALAALARPLAGFVGGTPPARDAGAPLGRPAVWAPGLALSLAAWAPVAAAVVPVVWATGARAPVPGLAATAARGILGGALSLVPVGAGTSGFLLLRGLRRLGVGAAPEVVFVFRATTAWLSIVLGAVALALVPRVRRHAAAHDHFDEIDACYDAWLPAHYRHHLVGRKTAPMIEALARLPPGARGLDIGCGRGWYLAALRDAGARMAGVDLSARQLVAAQEYLGGRPLLAQGSVLSLPYKRATFDFVYIVNVLHHVSPPAAQRDALAEIARVVKPGGLVFVHEMNVRNPLFRFYLGYVFPIVKGIEEGTEYYLDPRTMTDTAGLRLREVRYFTFVPDFVPLRLLAWSAGLERRLEASPLAPYAAHFVAVHERVA